MPPPPSLRQRLEPDIDFAFVEFGLSEEQFLRQTPRLWQRRVTAWQNREERVNRRFARVCAVIAWANGADDVTEESFLPQKVKEQSEDEMLSALFAAASTKPPSWLTKV